MDDETPLSNRHSGEWRDLTSWMRRLEGKLDNVMASQGTAATANALLDQRLTAVESWKEDQESERRQMGLGTKLAILSGIAGPVATLVILNLHHL